MAAAHLSDLRPLVSRAATAAFAQHTSHLDDMGPDLEGFLMPGFALLERGKRSRALLACVGYVAAGGHYPTAAAEPVVRLAASLELFQAAALVHDDIMDQADTRRGLPTAHHHFAQSHRDQERLGSSVEHGQSAAILLGDLFLAASSAEVDAAVRKIEHRFADNTRAAYHRMTTEVASGQYLDILAESTALTETPHLALDRAIRVVTHKSARYSVEHPLVIGAALAGADDQLRSALAGFGLPLGIAFQCRDDDLGVFGNPAVTGKPAGGDLREGKRTALLAMTFNAASPAQRDTLIKLVGHRDITDDDVATLRDIVESTGARADHEKLIARYADDARRRLATMDRDAGARVPAGAKRDLDSLLDTLISRAH